MIKAWHFIGPVTRFANRNQKVFYEIAQVRFYAININPRPEDNSLGSENIKIYMSDEVRHY